MIIDKRNYKLYQGDCIEIMGEISGKSVDLVVTDPPYLMDYQSNRRKKKIDLTKLKTIKVIIY